MKRVFFASAVALLLAACATLVSGTTQDLTVNTNPPGASCTVNRQGVKIGQINSTPGIAKVDRTRDDITLVCDKDGYQQATFIIHSGFEAATLGNIAVGGLIGLGIDAATGATNHYDSVANVTFVPAVASAAPVAHDPSATTPTIAVAPAASAPPSTAAPSPPLTAAASPPPAPGTWTAKLHWIPSPPPSPKFGSSGESILAYDIALTNVSIDADKLNIASEKSNITGSVAGGRIELDGWYKDPWGYVNSVKGSLTGNGGRFTGQGTCYNTQLATSAPTTEMTRHYCDVELSQIQ